VEEKENYDYSLKDTGIVYVIFCLRFKTHPHRHAGRNLKTQLYFYSSNWTNLKSPALRFSVDRKQFENSDFRKR